MNLYRLTRILPALLCMAAIFWFSAQPGDEVYQAAKPLFDSAPTLGDALPIPWLKIGHVAGYGLLGAALFYALSPGERRAAVGALAITLLYALSDEFHQSFVPGRSMGARDVMIDVGAAASAIALLYLARRLTAEWPLH